MTKAPIDRPPARRASAELLVLQRWEGHCAHLIAHTGRWPKSIRFTLTQRVHHLALDLLEQLIDARYSPQRRSESLAQCNRDLERMRFLLRLARTLGHSSGRGFERAMRGLDEVGRMIHGWRQRLGDRK